MTRGRARLALHELTALPAVFGVVADVAAPRFVDLVRADGAQRSREVELLVRRHPRGRRNPESMLLDAIVRVRLDHDVAPARGVTLRVDDERRQLERRDVPSVIAGRFANHEDNLRIRIEPRAARAAASVEPSLDDVGLDAVLRGKRPDHVSETLTTMVHRTRPSSRVNAQHCITRYCHFCQVQSQVDVY